MDGIETAGEIAALENFADGHDLAELERFLAGDHLGQIEALENFVATGLASLERILAKERQGQIVALKNLAADTPSMEKLKVLNAKWLAELDIFDVLKITDAESAHSNFLAWLLAPQRNHVSGDHFLSNFLLRTCMAGSKLGISTITRAKIHDTDWSQTEVYREWRNIDILILNRQSRFVCAIENKIWAGEGIDGDGISQLTRYRETLENEYPDFTRHLVFLSPQGLPSQQETERSFWVPADYPTILELLEQTICHHAAMMSEDVRVFLQQYATTLRRNIVPESNQVQQLAREIYLKHREAIELIIKYKPDFEAEAKEFFREAISRQQNWVLDGGAGRYLRYRSTDWDDFSAFRTGTGWSPSNSLLTFHVDFGGGRVNQLLVLGPSSDAGIRLKMHACIGEHPDIFSRAGQNLPRTFFHVDSQGLILDESYLVDWDAELVKDKIEAWISSFAENKFPRMNEIIVGCLREYESENPQR